MKPQHMARQGRPTANGPTAEETPRFIICALGPRGRIKALSRAFSSALKLASSGRGQRNVMIARKHRWYEFHVFAAAFLAS